MKKYKLIKEYPGGPKINTIASQRCILLGGKTETHDYILDDTFHQPLPKNKVEDYPEFWEEIKESPQISFKEHTSKVKQVSGEYIGVICGEPRKPFFDPKPMPNPSNMIIAKEEPNYLITAFRDLKTKDIFTIQSNGKYENPSRGEYHLDSMITILGFCEIYSVKNSKGEEFTIVDKCNDDEISGFKIGVNNNPNYMYVTSKDSSWGLNLESLTKEKSPIYTTTDSVEVFEGDRVQLYLVVNKDNDLISFGGGVVIDSFLENDLEVANRYLTFTSEENRDKYIKENQRKPVFISADGKEFYSNDTDYSLFSVLPKANWQENRYRLSDCIKFPKKEWLHFHTKEARQEYIDNNKPKYSLNDIEKAYSNTLSPIQSPLFNSFKSNLINLGK